MEPNENSEKLFFKNGIYDMKTGLFIEDTDMVSEVFVPHYFPERIEDEITYARDLIFELVCDNPQSLITTFAKALSGSQIHKKIYYCTGKGKTTLEKLFSNCFGEYIGRISSEFIKTDIYQRCYNLKYYRILFVMESDFCAINESQINDLLTNQMTVRHLYERNFITFNPQFIPFITTNSEPEINDVDQENRICYKLMGNFDIKQKINDPKFIRGFIHLLLDSYKYFVEYGDP